MDLDALADWVAIGGTFALGSAFIGIGLARIFALMDRVARIEAFADDVCYELVSQEQTREIGSMREQMQRIQSDLDELHSRSDSVGAEAL